MPNLPSEDERNNLQNRSPIKKRPIADWLGSKFFSMIHGTNLVYNTCWEDPRLDRAAMELRGDDTVLVITSAGCNALDYALDRPEHVYAVDVNHRQNALLELKLAAIKQLDYEQFFSIFGRGRLAEFSRVYDKTLRHLLSPASQQYWDDRTHFFDGKRSFYYRGSSGTVAKWANYYIDKIARVRDAVNALFEAKSVDEQKSIYDETLRRAFTNKLILSMIGNRATLSMMGVPHQQRQQVELHFGRGIVEFIEWCVESVFTCIPIHDNYFWRVYLFGQYSPTCCPRYLEQENFEALKGGLVDKVTVHTKTVEGFLRENDVRISRYVLLDHMDWLSTYRYPQLESEWQMIVNRAREDARILFRSGALKVDYVDPIQVTLDGKRTCMGEILRYYYDLAEELHQQCRVHTYGSFYVADLVVE